MPIRVCMRKWWSCCAIWTLSKVLYRWWMKKALCCYWEVLLKKYLTISENIIWYLGWFSLAFFRTLVDVINPPNLLKLTICILFSYKCIYLYSFTLFILQVIVPSIFIQDCKLSDETLYCAAASYNLLF